MPDGLDRIVLFTGGLVNPGGAERLVVKEAEYFSKRAIKVKILTFELDKKSLFGYDDLIVEVISARNPLSRVLSLRRKIIEFEPDLVVSQSCFDSEFLYLATFLSGIPYVTHIHGTLFWFDDRRDLRKYGFIYRRAFSEIRNSLAGHREFSKLNSKVSIKEKLILNFMAVLDYLAVRKARERITLTNQLKWEIRKLYGKDAVVSRGCLDADSLNYVPKKDIRKELGLKDQHVVLSIGRLDRRKRIDVLINAFSVLCRKRKDIILIIGGTGEEEGRLRSLVRELEIGDRVRFIGLVPEESLFDYYACCDVFAFPSWTSSGITPYEALAAGRKVVWTSEADEPILEDKHVFVADPTVDEFAKALERALDTEARGRIDLSKYTWDHYFEKVYEVCSNVVCRRNQNPEFTKTKPL